MGSDLIFYWGQALYVVHDMHVGSEFHWVHVNPMVQRWLRHCHGSVSKVQAASTAAAVDWNAIGDIVWRHLGSCNTVEEGDAERRAITADNGEEAVDGADRGRPSNLDQFVEQVECVVSANVSGMVPVLNFPLQDASAHSSRGKAAAHSSTYGSGRIW